MNLTNTTTTEQPPAGGLSRMTLYILIGSLTGAVVLLAIILLIIFCRRKRQKQVFNSTIESPGAHSNLSFEDDAEQDDDPIYRPSPEMGESEPDYTHLNRTSGDRLPSDSYDEIDQQGNPSRQRIISADSDYENAAGIVYENYNQDDRNKRVSSAPLSPLEEETAPPLMPRGQTTNLFRQGTKAYNLYNNALQDYEIRHKDITTQEKIGKGHFSTVYSGIAARLPYSSDTKKRVAIKTMKSSASDSDKQEFLCEFEIMKLTNSLNHDNITRLLASVTQSHPCMIVLELMPNGNLRNFLRSTRSQDVYYNLHGNSSSLSERQLLQFGVDIANGMEGIADLQLLHRDLAARNILLDANLTCKISDFGFAKDILNKPEYKSKSVLHRARPVRWLAPESVLLFKHSILSDVWSYGIVLWEIVTLGNLPYPDMKVREVQQALSKGYRMGCPTHCSPDLYRVMACCWEEDPHYRPPFHQLVDKMRQLLDQATRMIDMDRIEEDDYIDILPPDEQELFIEPTHDSPC